MGVRGRTEAEWMPPFVVRLVGGGGGLGIPEGISATAVVDAVTPRRALGLAV
jgi:hypothetical protein